MRLRWFMYKTKVVLVVIGFDSNENGLILMDSYL